MTDKDKDKDKGKGKQHYTGDDEIIQRNMEKSREVIEARKRERDDVDAPVPFVEDMPEPEHVVDDMRDVPAGGQSNANVGGGTTKRHKSG